jgi:putative ABC transport system permease protein
MALGAARNHVLGQMLREGLSTALVGTVLGFVGAYLVGRTMQSMLFGVRAIDPLVLPGVAALLLACAVLACFIPAFRLLLWIQMAALRED